MQNLTSKKVKQQRSLPMIDDPDAAGAADHSSAKQPSVVIFGKLRYGYTGKHSEGNRFITDLDL